MCTATPGLFLLSLKLCLTSKFLRTTFMISAYLNKKPCTWTSGPIYGEGYNSFFLTFVIQSSHCELQHYF